MWTCWPITFLVLVLVSFGVAVTGMVLVNDGLGVLAIVGILCIFLLGGIDGWMFRGAAMTKMLCLNDSENETQPMAPRSVTTPVVQRGYRLPSLADAKV